MTKQTKTHAIAFALFAAVGLGAPAASWLSNAPAERPVPTLQAGLAEALPEAPAAAPEAAPVVVTVPEVVVAGHVAPKARKAPRKAEKTCSRQALEITGGGVRVCDVPRTDNGKAGLWAPIEKPVRLASRDLPSPTGLIR